MIKLYEKMLIRSSLLALFFMLLAGGAYAQYGTLKGTITIDGEPGAFAKVIVVKNGENFRGVESDEAGNFIFPNMPEGVYNVVIQSLEGKKEFDNVKVTSGLTTPLNVEIGAAITTGVVTIQDKLVKADVSAHTVSFSSQDIKFNPQRSPTAIVTLTAGVTNVGGTPSVRGGRAGATQTFIDGMRNIGNTGLPQSAVGGVNVTTGAIPPWLGDLTSGAVEIISKDPTPEHQFSAEGATSTLLDGYNYNLFAVSATGPLIKKQDSTLGGKVTKLGYVLAAEGEFFGDRSPSGIPITHLKDDVRTRIEQTPLLRNPAGEGFINSTMLLHNSDFETKKAKDQNSQKQISAFGKLEYKFNSFTGLVAGGTFRYNDLDYGSGGSWSLTNSLYANTANGYQRTLNGRAYLRFYQTILPDSADNSILKSLTYRVQADYGRVDAITMDNTFRENLFDYGYNGRFDYKTAEYYQLIEPGTKGHQEQITSGPYWQTAGITDTAAIYDPSRSKNAIYANYNKVIYNYMQNNPRIFAFPGMFPEARQGVFNASDLASLGGLPNGYQPTNAYSLFNMPGTIYNGFSKSRSEIFRLTGQAEVILGPKGHKDHKSHGNGKKGTHALRFGFEFDQRVERFYSVAGPAVLWRYMSNFVNKHIQYTGDSVQYAPQYTSDGFFKDTMKVTPYAYAANQEYFDYQLRKALGLNPRGIDHINIDAIDPSFFKLGMFKADELQQASNPLLSYYGYDYMGNVSSNRPDADHFTDPVYRPQNAYRPTYLSGFIQDKFEMDNIFLSIGLRVDRIDLNQKTPKDPYIFRDFFTAGDLETNAQYKGLLENNQLPSNIGKTWVPYVDNLNDPHRVLGYRDGNLWYDATGRPVDPTVIANATNGQVQPLIKRVEGRDSLTINAFKDYDPIVNFMPRVSFSFPITDRANFFAHYDVLTQRPTDAEIGLFTNYRFIRQNATEAIANPGLKSQRTIDFEVGFQQSLDEEGNLAVVLSAYYRELRDMIQIIRYRNAYPISYDGFSNVDFGTVKGFTLEFVTRRLAKGFLKIRSSYTLQFASGTGSSFSSSRSALNGVTGFSLLRNLLPFSYDQRHTLNGNIQFYFDEQSSRGPKIGSVYPLDNVSVSGTFSLGSGGPYTRSSIPNQADVQFGVNGTSRVAGTPFGSRLPFTYNLDLRIDKTFNVSLSRKRNDAVGEPGSDAPALKPKKDRVLSFDVYLLFLNVFNVQNTIGVYQYSGQPNISGYLESALGKRLIDAQYDKQAFIDQYHIKENNPGNYSAPRQIRLGLMVNF